MAEETKRELSSYYINLTSNITPEQYLGSNEGATIANDSIIFFIKDEEEDESKYIRDIWVKDSDGNPHLVSGYNRFFHLDNESLKQQEIVNSDKIGLMSPEMLKNLNAVIAMTDLEGEESKFNKLEENVKLNTSNIKELNKALSEIEKNIEKIIAKSLNDNKESFISEIEGKIKEDINKIFEGFINHTHPNNEEN